MLEKRYSPIRLKVIGNRLLRLMDAKNPKNQHSTMGKTDFPPKNPERFQRDRNSWRSNAFTVFSNYRLEASAPD